MPYIVTITTPYFDEERGADSFVTRTAVATLDEACEHAREMFNIGPGDQWGHDHFLPGSGAVDDLPVAGGKVGPLPDGTVIEVQRVAWDYIREHRTPGVVLREPGDIAQPLLDAFNGAA